MTAEVPIQIHLTIGKDRENPKTSPQGRQRESKGAQSRLKDTQDDQRDPKGQQKGAQGHSKEAKGRPKSVQLYKQTPDKPPQRTLC